MNMMEMELMTVHFTLRAQKNDSMWLKKQLKTNIILLYGYLSHFSKKKHICWSDRESNSICTALRLISTHLS